MKCIHCGGELSESAKFCSTCAHAVPNSSIEQSLATTSNLKPEFAPATVWRRLTNYFIDRVLFYIFTFVLGFLLALIPGVGDWFIDNEASWYGILVTIAAVLLYVVYFVIFEATLQRTIAKYITQTKVVMRDGSKPPLKNIIGRSFARLIPFEQFSFLTGKYPIGWHDSLSKTLVVPKHYTVEDVKKIDIEKLNTGKNTALVVILVVVGFFVVIAIIGILSSVVLVSLNTARTKGKDAMIKSALTWIRPNAEIYYSQNGDTYSVAGNCYQGMFTEPVIAQYLSSIQEYDPNCRASGDDYFISARSAFSSKNNSDLRYFCVTKNISANVGRVSDYGRDGERCIAVTYE